MAYLYHDAYSIIQLLPDSGRLYQQIPVEADANAAAAVYVRQRFGHTRIDELGAGDRAAGTIFRTIPLSPPPIETLLDRMDRFINDWSQSGG